MRATRVLSLSITLAAASFLANAQTFNKVQVDLPFAITAGSSVVPADNYEIRPVADQPDTFGFYNGGVTWKSPAHANADREARCGRGDDGISVPHPSRREIVARRAETTGRQR